MIRDRLAQMLGCIRCATTSGWGLPNNTKGGRFLSVTMYHNPKCTKSRRTLALLEDRGEDFRVVEYLKQPLERAELQGLVKALGFTSAREMMRHKEEVYQSSELDQVDEEALLAAIIDHPVLLERPIVVKGGRAAIGRPPENVLGVL